MPSERQKQGGDFGLYHNEIVFTSVGALIGGGIGACVAGIYNFFKTRAAK